jgi:hypothetical protein
MGRETKMETFILRADFTRNETRRMKVRWIKLKTEIFCNTIARGAFSKQKKM